MFFGRSGLGVGGVGFRVEIKSIPIGDGQETGYGTAVCFGVLLRRPLAISVMHKSPVTRPSLLIRLRDVEDRDAWCEFMEIYAPLVFGYARRKRLREADAADLTQEVMAKVYQLAGEFRYDRQRGGVRGWLLAVTRNALGRHWTRMQREPRGSGDTAVGELLKETPEPGESEDVVWHQEHERSLFWWAARRIRGEFRDSTWEVFQEIAVEGNSPQQVAKKKEMSVAAAYTAKSRVLGRIREEIDRIKREEIEDF